MMASEIGRRVFLAHLELSYRLGRRVTLAEFGRLIAAGMGRSSPFTATAVSKWEAGVQLPTPRVIEAIAELSGLDPGWISHGEKSAAPAPRPRAAGGASAEVVDAERPAQP
jgi:transcriptional regulator with XRE-family HTH domain